VVLWKTRTLTSSLKVTDEESDEVVVVAASPRRFPDDENFPVRRHDPLGLACSDEDERAFRKEPSDGARDSRLRDGSDRLDQHPCPKMFRLAGDSADEQQEWGSISAWCWDVPWGTSTLWGTGVSVAGASPFFSQNGWKMDRRLLVETWSPEMVDTELESSASPPSSEVWTEGAKPTTSSSWSGGCGRRSCVPSAAPSPDSWVASRAATSTKASFEALVSCLTPSTEGLAGHVENAVILVLGFAWETIRRTFGKATGGIARMLGSLF